MLNSIRRAAAHAHLEGSLAPPDPWPEAPATQLLQTALEAWATTFPLPLVLFDEIDTLGGASLRSVLRQLRSGYTARPAPFPASVVLCGLRAVRDYKAASGGDPTTLGSSSPFNISVKSVRLGDFTEGEVRTLYAQHTADTGQEFTEAALVRAFDYTRGQPWLVNALANEVIAEMGIEAPEPITVEHMDEAKERLILARATHLDSLVARLNEPRVCRIIEPIIAGELPEADDTFNDDAAYVRDLGLIGSDPNMSIANPIYQEVIIPGAQLPQRRAHCA